MRKAFFLICLLVLCSGFALAVPPTQNLEPNNGIAIENPKIETFHRNKDIDFHFHAFNVTSGNAITSGINCTFHLYNGTGNHIVRLWDNTTSNVYDYEFSIPAGNFTTTGDYSYIVQCDNGVYGGFLSSGFEIVDDGVSREFPSGYLAIAVLLLGVIFALLMFAHEFNYPALRYFIYYVCGWFVVLAASIPVKISAHYGYSLGNSLAAVYSGVMYLMFAVSFALAFYLFYKLFMYLGRGGHK